MTEKKIQIIINLLSIVTFILNLVISVLGFFPVNTMYSYFHDSYYEHNLYEIGFLYDYSYAPDIGVIITIFLIIMFIIFIFKFFNLKNKLIKKIIVLVCILLIFSVVLSLFIYIIDYSHFIFKIGIIVVCLLGLSTILSFFDICFRIKEFTLMAKNKTSKKLKKEKKSQYDNAIKKLRALKQLYDDGAITEEEYKEKKEIYIECI